MPEFRIHYRPLRPLLVVATLITVACGEAERFNTVDGVAPPGVPVTDYFDLPASAAGPAIPETGYLVEEVNDGVYWVTEGTTQMMFVVTDDGVIAVDAPPALGDDIGAAVADVTDRPITHVIYSHTHIDHIGAAGGFPSDARIIAHRAVQEVLLRAADPNRPVPTTVFDSTYTLEVGGKRLELIYPGSNHEPGNIFIHAPAEGVMMAVDLIFPGWMPWRRLALAEDVVGFTVASRALLDYEWDTLVSGHVTRLGTRADVALQNEFVDDLRAAAGTALGTVQLPDVTARIAPDDLQPWAIFDTFIDEVVRQCVEELTPRWADRLAGFDVFIWDQCFAMEQSLRIDGPPPQDE
ncbi:MAG: MBL fold metallo-hydrolase [Longimicrobiales bacterium]